MKALVGAFNQEKALVGAFSMITNLRMEIFEALVLIVEEHIRVHLHVHAGEGVVAVAAGLQAAAQGGGHREQLPGRGRAGLRGGDA